MPYVPPSGELLELAFAGEYQSPPGASVNLELDASTDADVRQATVASSGSRVGTPSLLITPIARAAGVDTSRIGRVSVGTDTPRIAPPGIDSTIVAGTPEYVRWRQFIEPPSLPRTIWPLGTLRARLSGGYNPPPSESLILNWFGEPYSPPPATSVQLEFGALGYGYVWPAMGDVSEYGTPAVSFPVGLRPSGIAPPPLGLASVQTSTNELRASGLYATLFGMPHLQLTGVAVSPSGIVPGAAGTPSIWNLLQFLRPAAFSDGEYGTAFVQGGVKHVTPNGYSATVFGLAVVINTTADQFVTGAGRIAPPGVAGPDVSPRSLFPFGIHGSAYGTPLVQRTPSPYGFDTMVFGQPSIEYWTKWLRPSGIEPGEPGYPRVFDPTQKVFPSSVLRSTVFGDVTIINQKRYIRVPGEDYFQGSDWAQVESNRRYITATGLLATGFGDTNIRNRWPTVAPFGFDAMRPPSDTETGIGYSVRYLRPSGIYRTAYGRPTLTKTPEIAPEGFAGELGTPTVWYKIRRIEANGHDLSRIDEPTIWFRYRHVAAPGFASDSYGATKLEHSTRRLETRGSAFMVLGSPSIQALNRTISPAGIFEDFATGHMVGTDRWLRPVGYDAARFGTRIIPEIQNLYPQGFTGLYGLPTIWNETLLVKPAGFLTVGMQPADRWGLSRVFNSDQYITMYFDPDSHLNPPAWPQWTSIENRNRVMRTTGSDMARLGLPQIDNNARQMLPAGILPPDPPAHYQAGLVAYRIRHAQLEGIEPPYLSTWAVVYNDAFVLRPSGFVATQFGTAVAENTRRYFPYIGGFDTSAYGYPMVADRVRRIEFESRYTIAPPPIPLPEAKLYTRYVTHQGSDMFGQGWASLSIHRTIITPRWTHQDFFGWPETRNLTPELRTRGRNTEEFGEAFIRLEWRPVGPTGTSMQLFGQPQIADRDRTITVHGWRSGAVGDKLRVIRLGAPPYSEQTISLRGEVSNGEELDGQGISPPGGAQINVQVPTPVINQQVVYVQQDLVSTLFGDARITANSIRVEPGYWEMMIGTHIVSLKRRTISIGPFQNDQVFDPSPARINPQTIWAVREAPRQAIENHIGRQLHYVDEGPTASGWIKGMGRPSVALYHRFIRPSGINPNANNGLVGRPRLENRRHYIRPEGVSTSRFGWHVIPGPQDVVQFDSSNMQLFGRAVVARGPYLGPQDIKPPGLNSALWGANEIQLLNRPIYPQGYMATLMGTRLSNDRPYMWQGLRVGPHVPLVIGGFETERLGEPWASFRVRELATEGFDAFLSEYQLEMFGHRMRVRRIDPTRPFQQVEAVGLDHSAVGVPNVLPGVHFIRPDGNADQYRKGVF